MAEYRHNGDDIIGILNKYVSEPTKRIESRPGSESFKYAARQLKKGQDKLWKLQLSPEDKQHISLLHSAFSNMRQAMEAAAKGDIPKYYEKLMKGVKMSQEYERRCKT